MKLQTFLGLLSAMIGLVGVIYVSRGALLKPKDMVHSTTHYSAMAWPSNEIITSMATQKHDTLTGVIYVMIAFGIQVLSLMFINEDIIFLNKRIYAILLACSFVFVSSIILAIINSSLRKSDELQMKKIIAQDYCNKRFVGRPVDTANAKGLEDMSFEYFGIRRKDSEDVTELIKRIAEYIEWELPKTIDFSRIQTETGNN